MIAFSYSHGQFTDIEAVDETNFSSRIPKSIASIELYTGVIHSYNYVDWSKA